MHKAFLAKKAKNTNLPVNIIRQRGISGYQHLESVPDTFRMHLSNPLVHFKEPNIYFHERATTTLNSGRYFRDKE
jgi:hypothetical protein